ncbi:MAG TPA: hypothetical protein VHO50_07670 [Bacteroidales bacterium]|nr:hypothetical protein [Bacteroidales bacterium]
MNNTVDFENVTIDGLESSSIAESLAGLRANEARYFKNKYNHDFITIPADESQDIINYVNNILKKERDTEIEAKPLETSSFQVENLKFDYVAGTIRGSYFVIKGEY